ncbi:hypothetical protein ACH5RR_026225 [Cinchona calisaya]|uniref:Uncharacterized protein n=1 Tax=Cinchona calisaya TaxID=153742 RepID=A0ABD2Z1Y6_9GENT
MVLEDEAKEVGGGEVWSGSGNGEKREEEGAADLMVVMTPLDSSLDEQTCPPYFLNFVLDFVVKGVGIDFDIEVGEIIGEVDVEGRVWKFKERTVRVTGSRVGVAGEISGHWQRWMVAAAMLSLDCCYVAAPSAVIWLLLLLHGQQWLFSFLAIEAWCVVVWVGC